MGEYRELLDTNAEYVGALLKNLNTFSCYEFILVYTRAHREADQNEDEVAALTDAAAAGVGFTTHEMGAVPGGGGGLPPFLDYPQTAMPAAAPTGYPVGYYPGQTNA